MAVDGQLGVLSQTEEQGVPEQNRTAKCNLRKKVNNVLGTGRDRINKVSLNWIIFAVEAIWRWLGLSEIVCYPAGSSHQKMGVHNKIPR